MIWSKIDARLLSWILGLFCLWIGRWLALVSWSLWTAVRSFRVRRAGLLCIFHRKIIRIFKLRLCRFHCICSLWIGMLRQEAESWFYWSLYLCLSAWNLWVVRTCGLFMILHEIFYPPLSTILLKFCASMMLFRYWWLPLDCCCFFSDRFCQCLSCDHKYHECNLQDYYQE